MSQNQAQANAAKRDSSGPSREQLLHLLAEAAELEHNILCSYLFAAFSLKQREDEDVNAEELEAIGGWRGDLMDLCIEEMVHLAQVANLMVAIGSRPHFNRPNFPVAPGYHPAGVAIGLAPFGLDVIDHFIFLERPEESAVADSDAFDAPGAPRPPEPDFVPLMPRAPDYKTIGEFYAVLRAELERASRDLGERRLFCGPADLQLTGDELRSPQLVVVGGLDDARRAIDFIVEQGEGSGQQRDGSHFGRFEAMKGGLLALRAKREGFEPARQVGRHPVMHAPVDDDRIWIDGSRSAPVIDAANAAYSAMLRCLAQLYETPATQGAQRGAVLGAALAAMKVVTALGTRLTELPARDDSPFPRAGMSFAMLRAVEGTLPGQALATLAARLAEIAERMPLLDLAEGAAGRTLERLAEAASALEGAQSAQPQAAPRS